MYFSWQGSRFQKTQFKISREREIFEWAARTLEGFPDLISGEPAKVEHAKARLSAQIDIGRLLFPNDHTDSVGSKKPIERRGLRSHVLDPLVGIYRMKLPEEESLSELEDLRRRFIYYVGNNFTPVLTDTSPEALAAVEEKTRSARQ
jgi:hypothetical protein